MWTHSREDRIKLGDPAKTPAGVLCCGNLVLDILVRPVTELAWGTTTWVETIDQSIGGNGASTAYALAKLGNPVRLIGCAGIDEFGDRILRTLESAGVDVTHVVRVELATPLTIGLVHPSGDRALLHQPGASLDAFSGGLDLTQDLISDFDRFHLANIFALPCLQPFAAGLLHRAQELGLKTSLDTGWDNRGRWMETLAPCLPYVDVLFVNAEEARQLTGTSDPKHAARIFREQGANEIIFKLGERGCAVFAGSEVFDEPGFPVPVADTTGAGDCFAGGFLAALQRGYDDREAARFANAVGALSVQCAGSVAGMLSFDETVRWMGR